MLSFIKKWILFFCFLTSLFLSSNAQFTEILDNEPPGLQWQKIDTDFFIIVFPKGLTSEAQQLANRLEFIFDILLKDSPQSPKRLTLLLSNQGIEANGYFRLAPRMSEFYHLPTSLHSTGVVDWYDLLAIHEGRHVIQFEELNQGFTKIAGILFGDLGQMAASYQAVPLWFFEGDAVWTETEWTSGGRGRSPAFDMEIRALLLSRIRYGYHKAYLGSYKDWYPNHYHLGYLLFAHAKQKYGADFGSRIYYHAARSPNFFLPFTGALKQVVGLTEREFYHDAMNELESFWKRQQTGVQVSDFLKINSENRKVWTSYISPQYDTDGAVYAQKTGMGNPLTIIRFSPDGTEKKITQFSPLSGFYNRLSVENHRACWSEREPDIRWGKRNYSALAILDLKSNKLKRITKKHRLFDPALSPDGKKVAAVEFTPQRQCSLLVLDAETGQETIRIPNPNNDFIMMPSWSREGSKIVFVHQNKEGRAVSVVWLASKVIDEVFPYSSENITHPVFYKRYILFNSPYSGIDNIYALDTENSKRYRVTSSRFGAFFPAVSPDGESLVYNDYSIWGYDVVEIPLEPWDWKAVESVEVQSLPFFELARGQAFEKRILDFSQIQAKEYDVQKYRPLAHLLNVHSWTLLPTSPDPGFYFFSNDRLNMASLVGGIKYNLNEKVVGFEVTGLFAGLYPLLDAGFSYGGRSEVCKSEGGIEDVRGWRETSLSLGFQIPMNLSRGIYRTSLSLGSRFSLTRIANKTFVEPFDNGNGLLLPLTHELRFSRFRKSALRDLKPRGGQVISLVYRHTPIKGDYRGALSAANLGLYFPGLLRHHSLFIRGMYENQYPGNYHFPSPSLFPRGYDYRYHDSFFKISTDYALPLAYPDWALDGILYIKRVRANAFFDYGRGKVGGGVANYLSGGIELMTDFHLLNLPVELEIGLRLTYRLKDKKVRAEIILFDLFFDSF